MKTIHGKSSYFSELPHFEDHSSSVGYIDHWQWEGIMGARKTGIVTAWVINRIDRAA